MRAKDIRTGVVYGITETYGSPRAVLFLSTSLHRQPRRGTGSGQWAVPEKRVTRPRRGSGWSEQTIGYPVVLGNTEDLAKITDLAAPITAQWEESHGMRRDLLVSLAKVTGPYDEVMAAYEEAQELRRREKETVEQRKAAARTTSQETIDALAAHGIAARHDYGDDAGITLSPQQAAQLTALLLGKDI